MQHTNPTLAAGATKTIIAIPCHPPGTVSFTVDLKVTTQDGTFSTMTKTFP